MTFLEVIQLIGYTLGAALHFWIGALLVRQSAPNPKLGRVLLALTFCTGAWHASNLLLALHSLLGLAPAATSLFTRSIETLAVCSITTIYSLLLHAHLHLWADMRGRSLIASERVRVFLSYVPLIFLIFAVSALWNSAQVSMFEKLEQVAVLGASWNFVKAFALWAVYALGVVGVTDALLARRTEKRSEKFFLRTLATTFFLIAVLILLTNGFGIARHTIFAAYLQTLANLGSLLPTALLAYHIYRHRYLELIIRDSLVVAVFAVLILIVYLYGIRLLGDRLTEGYGLRSGVIETLLTLALALIAAPLRGWLERRFTHLFSRETTLYRDVLRRINMIPREASRYKQLPELLGFVAERSAQILGVGQVRFLLTGAAAMNDEMSERQLLTDATAKQISNIRQNNIRQNGDIRQSNDVVATSDAGCKSESEFADELLRLIGENAGAEAIAVLRDAGWEYAFALRRESETFGVMLVGAPGERLTEDVRQAFTVLAAQSALAVSDCRLVQENIELYARIAHGERLAALGQMAATVAHEIKNPLSAIKSIAQVMREDHQLAAEYARDLDLIVGETDRLNRSVTQLLSWTRLPPTNGEGKSNCIALVDSVVGLFRHDTEARRLHLEHRHAESSSIELNPEQTAALRDALSNLILNAIQATPPGETISVETSCDNANLIVRIRDGGAGIPHNLQTRIWEPFFTTKQRGTGLGLPIVKKRIEDIGGTVRLIMNGNHNQDAGACFELRVPLNASASAGTKHA